MAKTLLSGQDDNGSGTAVTPEDTGKVEFVVYGTWDSGEVTFEQTPDSGTTWIALGSALSANGRLETELYHTGQVRATVASVASAGADLDAFMFGVPANSIVVTDF